MHTVGVELLLEVWVRIHHRLITMLLPNLVDVQHVQNSCAELLCISGQRPTDLWSPSSTD